VTVNGRTVATRRGKTVTDPVIVSKVPRGRRLTLGVALKLEDGKVIEGTRTFRTCTR
jgi:hypothetical protein